MHFKPTPSGGRLLTGDLPHGKFRVEWDARGRLISEFCEPRTPPQRIPKDFDPATERQGCCDPPAI